MSMSMDESRNKCHGQSGCDCCIFFIGMEMVDEELSRLKN